YRAERGIGFLLEHRAVELEVDARQLDAALPGQPSVERTGPRRLVGEIRTHGLEDAFGVLYLQNERLIALRENPDVRGPALSARGQICAEVHCRDGDSTAVDEQREGLVLRRDAAQGSAPPDHRGSSSKAEPADQRAGLIGFGKGEQRKGAVAAR